MTDAELSRELALALGYHPESVRLCHHKTIDARCEVFTARHPTAFWHHFDYRDPTVCLPLIKWLMLEGVNVWSPDGIPTAWEWSAPDGTWGKAAALEEAVCKSVIAVGRK